MELEKVIYGSAIGFGGGLIIGIVVDREWNPKLELTELVDKYYSSVDEIAKQEAKRDTSKRNIAETIGVVASGLGIYRLYNDDIAGYAGAVAYFAGLITGEYISRKIRHRAKLKPEEIEAIAQYSTQLDWAISSGNKEAIYKMLGRIADYIENLFYKKNNVDIFNTPILVEMDKKFKAAGYKIGKIKNPPTALNTPN